MTPHIEALDGDIAEVVIMPGDPKRAKYIADNYLTDAKCINEVRGMLGFTGFYKGKRVTVMASGMGMPSMGIYSYELYKFYNVKKIIRVGSCGSYDEKLDIYSLILASEAYSDTAFAKIQNGDVSDVMKPSMKLNEEIIAKAKEMNFDLTVGRIYSSDVFYSDTSYLDRKKQSQALAVEMESFALFHIAKVLNREAACLLTVSDSFVSKKETTSQERETSFDKMIELALEAI